MGDARQEDPAAPGGDAVGLCRRCAHAAVQHNARGSAFWRCRRADVDPTLRRYPPLPVLRCHAFEPGEPRESGG